MAALMSSVIRGLAPITEQKSSSLLLLLLKSNNSVVVSSRRFVRGLRRRPVAVLYPGEERETLIKAAHQNKQRRQDPGTQQHQTDGRRVKENSSEPRGRSSGVQADRCSVRAQLGGLRFDKALPGDKRLAKIVSIARSRAFREKEGKVLLEGKRLICDAMAAGASPQVLFFSRVERLQELPLDKLGQASLVKVKFEDLRIWSDLVTPQGVIAIFSKPDQSRLTFPKDLRLQSIPLFLICDTVRDPGALGTILRCAAAAGCDRVLLTQGCVDPWEPKVLRAAMGAHFRLPVFSGLNWDSVLEHLPNPVTVHVADDTRSSDAEVRKPGRVNHEVVEQYTESDSDDDEVSLLEQKVYHENWAQRNTALVISDETRGLSSEALQLAEETDGYKLFVPLAPGAERLNSAMTASVLLFEGRRQLMKFTQKGCSES
ncbi:rRNA methyltransferase 3A, mitochondrial isoform X2 [Neoarius graeffei]|uniref:rRNA methyltransferase 3A, mitochondrial isoform X2 n=1 Tax=Neoarius graeffei TaxID=443677 RepID=UPI00298BD2A5|nr:rRNA methyltransferase 3A, mitochondrial isoform X2 [Neoarius graeffei]